MEGLNNNLTRRRANSDPLPPRGITGTPTERRASNLHLHMLHAIHLSIDTIDDQLKQAEEKLSPPMEAPTHAASLLRNLTPERIKSESIVNRIKKHMSGSTHMLYVGGKPLLELEDNREFWKAAVDNNGKPNIEYCDEVRASILANPTLLSDFNAFIDDFKGGLLGGGGNDMEEKMGYYNIPNSIAPAIAEDTAEVQILRGDIVDHIRRHLSPPSENGVPYELLIEGDAPSYLTRMNNMGMWGGMPEIYAFSEMKNVNIVIHAATYVAEITRKNSRDTIHLLYDGRHYELLRNDGTHIPIQKDGNCLFRSLYYGLTQASEVEAPDLNSTANDYFTTLAAENRGRFITEFSLNDKEEIKAVNIVGRPKGKFGGAQGSHTAPFGLNKHIIETFVLGKTEDQAKKGMKDLLTNFLTLCPGFIYASPSLKREDLADMNVEDLMNLFIDIKEAMPFSAVFVREGYARGSGEGQLLGELIDIENKLRRDENIGELDALQEKLTKASIKDEISEKLKELRNEVSSISGTSDRRADKAKLNRYKEDILKAISNFHEHVNQNRKDTPQALQSLYDIIGRELTTEDTPKRQRTPNSYVAKNDIIILLDKIIMLFHNLSSPLEERPPLQELVIDKLFDKSAIQDSFNKIFSGYQDIEGFSEEDYLRQSELQCKILAKLAFPRFFSAPDIIPPTVDRLSKQPSDSMAVYIHPDTSEVFTVGRPPTQFGSDQAHHTIAWGLISRLIRHTSQIETAQNIIDNLLSSTLEDAILIDPFASPSDQIKAIFSAYNTWSLASLQHGSVSSGSAEGNILAELDKIENNSLLTNTNRIATLMGGLLDYTAINEGAIEGKSVTSIQKDKIIAAFINILKEVYPNCFTTHSRLEVFLRATIQQNLF
jgi:hypothetical protein